MDENFYQDHAEESFDNDCGIWDGANHSVGHTEDFNEWRAALPELRPYEIAGGEVAMYRLELMLNEVGKAFLMLDRFLESGERPGGPNSESFSAATQYGLKYGIAVSWSAA